MMSRNSIFLNTKFLTLNLSIQRFYLRSKIKAYLILLKSKNKQYH